MKTGNRRTIVFFLALVLGSCARQESPVEASVEDQASPQITLNKGPEGGTTVIGDLVWCDLNNDGVYDAGEPGIEGVVVNLLCAGADGIYGTGDDYSASQTTDANGYYLFTEVPGGYPCRIWVDLTTLPDGKIPGVCRTRISCNPKAGRTYLNVDFCFTQASEGCTPGYWKQEQHFDSWPEPYTPEMLFGDVFEDAFPGMTLVQVAANGGGGLDALGRHTVAALLNGASDGVSYQFTAEEVVDMFNDVFPGSNDDYEALKDVFEDNNELGCPLN